RQEKTRLFLKIPNYVIKTIMWEYIETNLKKEYKINLDLNELRKTIEEMAYEGRIKPYIEYISRNVLKVLSNRDIINFDEKYIKVILITYLVNSKAYRPISERETEGGYIDIYLERDIRMPDVKYEWLIELKYLKKSEKGKVDKIKEEGIKQLKRYIESRGLKDRKDVKQALVIFIGKDEYQVIEI
ncbi:PD-(D/E)XK nuclease domain-containing protein, partial [Caldanaerobacter sp.]